MNPQSEKKMANGDRLAETMTKREAFAMAAMQAIVGSIHDEDAYQRLSCLAGQQCMKVSQWIANDAIKQADALLEALEKRNG